MQKRNYNSIDLLKLVLSFLVVAIHTDPLKFCKNKLVLDAFWCLADTAVPVFFLAAGFFLENKIIPSLYSESIKSQLAKATRAYSEISQYLVRMIYLYLIWSLLYLPLAVLHFAAEKTGLAKSVLLYLRGFLLIGEQYNSWPLWYLLSTIYALAFILFLYRHNFSLKNIAACGFLLLIFGTTITQLIACDNAPIYLSGLKKIFEQSITTGRIFSGAFYIPIGMILAKKRIALPVSILMMTFGYVINVAIDGAWGSTLFLAISAIGLFSVVETIKLKDSNIYPYFRRMSICIYFIHMYVWTAYYTVVHGEKTYGVDSFVMTLLISIAISVCYLYISKKCRNSITAKTFS